MGKLTYAFLISLLVLTVCLIIFTICFIHEFMLDHYCTQLDTQEFFQEPKCEKYFKYRISEITPTTDLPNIPTDRSPLPNKEESQ